MGDYYEFVDPQHPSDELPIHYMSIISFCMDKFDVTNNAYCDYLNSAFSQGLIKGTDGQIFLPYGMDVLFRTRQTDQYSSPDWRVYSKLDIKIRVKVGQYDS